jgi:unsaturated rhamnogalacturonyl hydrolase
VLIPVGNEIFKNAHTVYLKEISTLKLSGVAKPILNQNGAVIVATAKFGKGTVFVLGDPWLYNEYTDGRKLPAEYDNFKAAKDLSKWLLQQARSK